MYDMVAIFLALATPFIVGLMVGYSYGENHATTIALKAKWEQEAKEWDERHERLMRELEAEL